MSRQLDLLPRQPTFADAVPAEHTETQVEWARRMDETHSGMMRQLAGAVARAGVAGITPWEATEILEFHAGRIVGVRSSFTLLHQAGEILRLERRRNGEHVYLAPWAWQPSMPLAPSKPHHGRGS